MITLRELAFARSGDKGDVVNVGVMAKAPEHYPRIVAALTPARIAAHYGELVTGPVEVYPLPKLHSVNVVLRGALGGGATSTLRFDQTGKSLGLALLRLEI